MVSCLSSTSGVKCKWQRLCLPASSLPIVMKSSYIPSQPEPKSSRADEEEDPERRKMRLLGRWVVRGAHDSFLSKQTSPVSPKSGPFPKDARPVSNSEPLHVSRMLFLHFSVCWAPLPPLKHRPDVPCSVKPSFQAESVTPRDLLRDSYLSVLCHPC